MDQEKIGKFIAECRKSKSLSQNDLAKQLGITNKAVSKWENGRCLPDISLLEDLSKLLDVSINEIIKGEKILKLDEKIADENINKALKYYEKAKKRNFVIKIILLVLVGYLFIPIFVLFFLGMIYENANVKVYSDKLKYQDYVGPKAKSPYRNKWGMSEEIFPRDISKFNVSNFKFVYYDPWDAQYLAYLVTEKSDEEVKRLESIGVSKYIGYYGVTGFNSKYNLLAMEADEYQGFVYALEDEENIIYVELIFCNYFYDLNYKKYINNEYLPLNFDATEDNKYREKMLKNS